MIKCLFVTNLPSPYRVDFFNSFGKLVELTVLYERKRSSERDKLWVGEKPEHFKEVFSGCRPYKTDQSKGNNLVRFVQNNDFDYIFITNYASPSVIKLIFWCIRHKVEYFLEYDGGFYKKDVFFKRFIKKMLICHASGHLDSSSEHIKYLLDLGVRKECICKYNFSSVKEMDILKIPPSLDEKKKYREIVSINEQKVVVAVGQFIHRKGFDLLIEAATLLPRDIGFYIIGGKPTTEYERLVDNHDLRNIHFFPFKSKNELSLFYKSADIFAMPTREDIWGLVVNEAMSYGLPVISSNKCISGIEMIKDGENGYLFESENIRSLADKINLSFSKTECLDEMARQSIETSKKYTIEGMALSHFKFLLERKKKV